MILRCCPSAAVFLVHCLLLLVVQIQSRRLPFGAKSTSRLGPLHEAFVGQSSTRVVDRLVGPTTKRPRYELWESLRGGALSLDESDEEEESDEETDEDEESDEEEEEEVEEIEEASFEDKDSKSPLESVMSMEPVTILLKTVAGSELLDHSLEVTVNRSRNVASLKQSLSRQLPGKPPIASMQLVLQGKVLDDEVLVQELVDDEDDEEEEEEEDASKPLVIQVDMIPPVDPKFAAPLQQRLPEMTVSDLLEAYALNEAAMYRTAAMLYRPETQQDDDSDDDEEEEESALKLPTSSSDTTALVSEKLRQDAARIRSELETTLLQSPKSQALLAETESPLASSASAASLVQQVRGERVRVVTNNAAATKTSSNFSRSLQHHLNIHWGASIRTALLFLFFGWFGGRTPLSRALLLLGAPAVFIVQARTIKAGIKEVAYAILKNPVGIVLSLLPAPQQAILSLNVEQAMDTLYGDLVEATSLSVDRSMADAALEEEYGDDWVTNSDEEDDRGVDLNSDEEDEEDYDKGVNSEQGDTDDEEDFFDAEEEENWDEEDE